MLLAAIALYAPFRSYLTESGYGDVNDFSAHLLSYVKWIALIAVPISVVVMFRGPAPRRRGMRGAIGRSARCHQCKQKLEEHTGSNCKFCGWIRCSCGACGCSFGRLA